MDKYYLSTVPGLAVLVAEVTFGPHESYTTLYTITEINPIININADVLVDHWMGLSVSHLGLKSELFYTNKEDAIGHALSELNKVSKLQNEKFFEAENEMLEMRDIVVEFEKYLV